MMFMANNNISKRKPTRRLYWTSLLSLVLGLLITIPAISAGNDGGIKDPAHITYINASSISGSTGSASDTLSLAYMQDHAISHSVKNIVSFKVLEETNLYIPGDFTATVNLRIYYGATPATSTYFTVTYTKSAGAKYNAIKYVSFNGADYVRVAIQSISAPAATVNGVSFDTKQVLRIEQEMQVVRYYNLAINLRADVLTHTTPSLASGLVPDGLVVNWSWRDTTGNNYTQLEWAWLENEMSSSYMNGSNFDTALLFKNNATRLDLPVGTNSYQIPLFYDGQGKLFFRVRPVSIQSSGSRIDGLWSFVDYYDFNGHNDSLNWQVTTSYAEEGKRKTVIQYYDGSLRGRQTVTKDNTTNTTVVAETMYDGQGRPAIQILPAPGISNIVAYTKNLNRFNGQMPDEDPTSYFDFTTTTLGNYGTTALNDSFGTARYYSPKNDEIAIGVNKNIPSAEGYPYTVTRYTPDATGRIMRQSGVGATMKLGASHDTKYWYGSPSQEELDGLFGTEVGSAIHYFKNMVQDANGQMSVSYTDMHGRTIATALAGSSPGNLQALNISDTNQYHNQAGNATTRNLLDKQSNSLKGNSVESINTLLVAAPTLYDFNYHLQQKVLKLPSCSGDTLSYPCKYDLEISITDESGDTPPKVTTYNNIDAGNIHDTITLQPGSYAIRKTLTINQASIQSYLQHYDTLTRGICKTQTAIIDSIQHITDSISGCGITASVVTCQSCLDSLGTYAVYKIKYVKSLGMVDSLGNANLSLLTASQEADIRTQYISDSTLCSGLNLNISHSLDIIRQQMLADVTPNTGQFARDTGTRSMYIKYNILYGTGTGRPFYRIPKNATGTQDFYYNATGSIDSTVLPSGNLATMDNSTFTSVFTYSWANALLPYHPEYSKLRYAENNLKPSYNYIDSFALLSTTIADPTLSDPYFTTVNTSDKPTMYNYITDQWQQGLSLWQYAYGGALGCRTLTDDAVRTACYTGMPKIYVTVGTTIYAAGFGNITLTTAQQSSAWEVFKGLYMQARNNMVNAYISNHTDTSDNQALVDQGYILQFPTSNTQMAQQYGWSEWYPATSGAVPAINITAAAQAATTSHCAAYVNNWRNTLLQCPQLFTAIPDSATREAVIASITSRMVTVCEKGTDATNPKGASNIAPGTTNADANFEQIINEVFASKGITKDQYCNPYTITFPKPYGKNPVMVKQYSAGIDTCNCKQFAKMKVEAAAAGKDTASLVSINQYLRTAYNDTLTSVLYAALRRCSEIATPQVTITKSFNATASVIYGDYYDGHENYAYYIDTTTDKIYAAYLQHINADPDNTDTLSSTYFKFDSIATIPSNATIQSAQLNLYPYQEYSYEYYAYLYYGVGYYTLKKAHSESGAQISFSLPNVAWSTLTPASTFAQFNRYAFTNVGDIYISDTIQGVSLNATSALNYWRTNGNNGFYMYISSLEDVSPIQYVNFTSSKSFGNLPSLSVTYSIPSDTAITIPLLTPQPLPEFLKCGFTGGSRCYGCEAIQNYTTEFKTIFANTPDSIAPVFATDVDSTTASYNKLYAQFLNYRTGLQHNWLYYAQQLSAANCPVGGLGTSSGCAEGSALDTLLVSSRSGATPTSYVARTVVELLPGFESNITDSFSVYINSNLLACSSITPSGGSGSLCLSDTPLTDTAGLTTAVAPCQQSHNMAVATAINVYQAVHQQTLANFQSAYLSLCTTVDEQFTVNYTNKEYHYTLYYYDQAGNLVKTVPPKGVYPRFDTAFTNGVERAKLAGTALTLPHTLTTNYRYNSLNQVVAQNTPDAGISQFWYDRLGRLALSQNAKQIQGGALQAYSYTRYDDLGRITQVGELKTTDDRYEYITMNDNDFTIWLNSPNATRSQITQTVYDLPYAGTDNITTYQQNLRNRVSYSQVWNNYTDSYAASATYYTYDIHGNVDTLVQDYGNSSGTANAMNTTGNRFKRMVYDYDLISGKVNQVAYQPGKSDAFYHHYHYDAENRITGVETSRDSVLWQRDADYSYYKHGPLAQTILGQLQVQGLDYAYTIQGWLKGINPVTGYSMNGSDDSRSSPVAQNAYGFSLHYYNGDYKNINGDGNTGFLSTIGATSLYNGNIAAIGIRIPKLARDMAYSYRYDQLNRLVAMDAFDNILPIAPIGMPVPNTHKFDPSATNDYKERISYDPNGNILKYLRNGSTANSGNLQMDSLNYRYYAGTNRLNHVKDNVAGTNYSTDIDDQSADNYTYDGIGNLITDAKEGIDEIQWSVYGKIQSITKNNGTVITYTYDAAGNRISKKVTEYGSPVGGGTLEGPPPCIPEKRNTTYYVRDASGNVMSVYKQTNAGSDCRETWYGSEPLHQSEMHVYGSSRLGIQNRSAEVTDDSLTLAGSYGKAVISTFTRGEKVFELSNHLGNVLVTVSDRKVQVEEKICTGIPDPFTGECSEYTGTGLVASYEADVITANDYYPFGMAMPGRTYNAANYRYGFNGKENDKDISEGGQDYGMRIYDSRIGKFLSVDPLSKSYPYLTPYQFASNKPINCVDLDGAEFAETIHWLAIEGTSRKSAKLSAPTLKTVFGINQNQTIDL